VTVRVQKNDETGLYELGDDVDGVFVSFADLPITAVDARVANAKANQEPEPPQQ
jgi:hypothetical protein